MACEELTVREQSFPQQNIFVAIAQILSNNKRPCLESIQSCLVRIENLKELCAIFATTNFTARR